jgi:tetratricopeptide (TPR) repeat protein
LTAAAVHIRLVDYDIGPLLDGWEYQPGQIIVRKFTGKDGREKLQLRVDVGILQMNADGRPDGKRPMGYSSLHEYYQARLYQYVAAHEGSDEGFSLNPEDCSRLQLEALQYHQRAFCLLQLEDYAGVIRDAERNRAVFEFVRKHGPPELASALLQFLPQQIMVLTRARGSLALEVEDYSEAIRLVEEGIAQIESFSRDQDRSDPAEESGEVLWLQAWLDEIHSKRPLSKREKLERALHEAVKVEDYEKAAKVRDQLRKLKE